MPMMYVFDVVTLPFLLPIAGLIIFIIGSVIAGIVLAIVLPIKSKKRRAAIAAKREQEALTAKQIKDSEDK